MIDRSFIDTNVLVYASIDLQGERRRTQAIQLLADSTFEFVASTQVLNELYRRLLGNKIPDADIQRMLFSYASSMRIVPVDIGTVKLAWIVRNRYGFSIWDCLILAAALEANCSVLYTEDLQHGQMIDNKLKIINPFKP